LGKKRNKKYGKEKPNDKNKKIKNIIWLFCVSAKPTEVPKNGAVHGVARRVAKKPVKKELT
tara:strand:- start:90 stop:272 length:183 start_codon:yes stop_codon:yes gene_type:complete